MTGTPHVARLAAIRARLDAATPGPWSAADEHGLWPEAHPVWCVSRMRPGYEKMTDADVDERGRTGGYLYDVAEVVHDDERTEADADLIAAAPDDLAWLLRTVDLLTDRLRAIIWKAHEEGHGALDSVIQALDEPQHSHDAPGVYAGCPACGTMLVGACPHGVPITADFACEECDQTPDAADYLIGVEVGLYPREDNRRG